MKIEKCEVRGFGRASPAKRAFTPAADPRGTPVALWALWFYQWRSCDKPAALGEKESKTRQRCRLAGRLPHSPLFKCLWCRYTLRAPSRPGVSAATARGRGCAHGWPGRQADHARARSISRRHGAARQANGVSPAGPAVTGMVATLTSIMREGRVMTKTSETTRTFLTDFRWRGDTCFGAAGLEPGGADYWSEDGGV